MSASSLEHMPKGRWAFDATVADVFDDMLERSIPLYDMTIELVCRMALRHLRAGDTVLELGVSTGNTLKRLRELGGDRMSLRLVGVDASSEMLSKAQEKLGASAELIAHDLRESLPYRVRQSRPRVVFLLWTAQFVPIEHRARLYREVHDSLAEGGALFVAEKLRGQTARHQDALVEAYHSWKVQQGYSREAVEAKARSLEGVLVPMDAPSQKAMLTVEGFSVEEIIRYLGFAAWHCLPAR